MSFTLAHLSDPHLAPLPPVKQRELRGKRAIGYLSWTLRRRKIHGPEVLKALTDDIRDHRPDHVALTGDLINIALPAEFTRAAAWLGEFGAPDWITVVPGNHDAYVKFPWETGMGLWADYMTGDLRLGGARPSSQNAAVFPFVRQRRNIAIVGLSTGVPAPMREATGKLGTAQIEAAGRVLATLRERGFYRIVLIHHPPLPGLAVSRKRLIDAPAFKEVLEAEGAELVLHGHNHQHMRTTLSTRHGKAEIIGVPSASTRPGGEKPPAAWYRYEIRRSDKRWLCSVTVRGYDAAAKTMTTENQFEIEHG